jgi:hypothetical protein
MAVVSITDLRCKIYPQIEDPELEGTPGSTGVKAESVLLTGDYLRTLGGVPYRIGDDWAVELQIGSLQTAVFTGESLTSCTLVMTIYDPISREVIDTRTSGVANEITLDGDQSTNPGLFWLEFVNTETPTAGTWDFLIRCTWSDSTVTTLIEGVIDIVSNLEKELLGGRLDEREYMTRLIEHKIAAHKEGCRAAGDYITGVHQRVDPRDL